MASQHPTLTDAEHRPRYHSNDIRRCEWRTLRFPRTNITVRFHEHRHCDGGGSGSTKSSWNVKAHGDARKGKWRGNWRMEWVASTLHTTSEHGVSSITTADAHTSAASSRPNWRPRRFKWTLPFRRKTKSGFCACAITFQLASTSGSKNFSLRTTRNHLQLASQRLQSFYATGGLRDCTLEMTFAPCSTQSPVTSCKCSTGGKQLA